MVSKESKDSENEKTTEHHEGAALKKVRTNPWMVSTVVLALVLIVLVVVFRSGFGAGASVSADEASKNIVTFINANPSLASQVTPVSSVKEGQLYKVTVKYQGQDVPVYATLDGKYMISSVIPLSASANTANTNTGTQTPPAEVPKTDKPKVEAFVFSYCPYGLQFEKALFPVYDLLKSKADINIVAIGAMHGEFEKVESYRQLCIKKNYNNDKLMAYLAKFDADTTIGACSGDATCLKPLTDKIYTSLGIDGTKIDACMAKDAEALYNADGTRAQSLGISGSPGFVVNGVEVQVNRSPDAIKTAICSAFTTAPAECSQTLSTTATSAGFGATAGSGASAASCG